MLAAAGITAGYGAVPVIWDVSVTTAAGEVSLVIGPNGAGKSTLVKAIIGELALMSGTVTLAGEDVSRLTEDQRAARGLGYVPQVRDVFGSLTVTENLQMGGYRLAPQETADRVGELFDRFPALGRLRKRYAQTLSGGERKLLAIARALVARPAVLMLDEPTANLAPAVADRVLNEVVRGLAESGTAVLLIEQRVALAVGMANHVYVLVDGGPRFTGSAAEFRALPDAGALFFTRAPAPPSPSQPLRVHPAPPVIAAIS